MMIRESAVAGSFYPAGETACRNALDACFADRVPTPRIPGRIIAGVVPHAGWSCSGRVAAAVFEILADQSPRTPRFDVVVIFGAVHRPKGHQAALFSSGRWNLPTGPTTIDDRLAQRVLGHTNLIVDDPYAHESEHSIEVQIPFLQRLLPEAKILPIMVPSSHRATEIGDAVARTVSAYGYNAAIVASSDLTHYGENYGFTPKGNSDDGLAWAKNVNDRRLIDRILELDADAIVPEALQHKNACGAGAIAAAISAAKTLGADHATLLDHTTSREIIGDAAGPNAVGYAGIVITAP